jgi:hypothetical protein
MRFRVPQFIEVEDKVIGPLTLKQFVYLAGGVGALIAIFLTLPFIFTLILGLPIVAFSAALAFYEVDGIPFIDILESGFEYVFSKKLYVWKRQYRQSEPPWVAADMPEREDPRQRVPHTGDSKLKDLAWSLDVKESSVYASHEEDEEQSEQ